jgi:zona occludens toxin
VIYLVQGTPGSGKTYYACRRIDQAIAAGKVVVTNVQLAPDWAERIARGNPWCRLNKRARARRAARYRRQLLVIEDVDELLRVRVEGAGEGRWVAVLDEAAAFLNSRSWNDKHRGDLVRWFQRHRHYGADVYLIAQLAHTIDKQVRELFEESVRLKNLRNFKLMGVRIFRRSRFVAIHTWNTKDQHVLRRESYGLSRRVARLYNTHQLASDLLADCPDALVLPRPADAPVGASDDPQPGPHLSATPPAPSVASNGHAGKRDERSAQPPALPSSSPSDYPPAPEQRGRS